MPCMHYGGAAQGVSILYSYTVPRLDFGDGDTYEVQECYRGCDAESRYKINHVQFNSILTLHKIRLEYILPVDKGSAPCRYVSDVFAWRDG